jgi:hypothetical protein
MGRSPFFTVESIQRPPIDQTSENLILLKSLQSLKKEQKVKINIASVPSHFGLPRSISIYEYTPSAVSSDIVYEVTSSNYEPALGEIGLSAIALRDQRIPEVEHITGWIITSDGYIRETEHYTILYKLNGLKIIE